MTVKLLLLSTRFIFHDPAIPEQTLKGDLSCWCDHLLLTPTRQICLDMLWQTHILYMFCLMQYLSQHQETELHHPYQYTGLFTDMDRVELLFVTPLHCYTLQIGMCVQTMHRTCHNIQKWIVWIILVRKHYWRHN